MPAYRVTLSPAARRDLTAIWVAGPDRTAVSQAQATADRWLATNPYRYGRPLAEGLWALTVLPPHFSFVIDDDKSRVRITNVNRVA